MVIFILNMTRLLFLFLLFSVCANSQDTVRLVHKEYATVFSKSKKYPVLVEWWLTKQKVSCTNPIPRKDQFAPDPLLREETDLSKDYNGSGFDRGHIAPAADNQCSGKDAMTQSFYFSNMAPQYPSLNRGDWKTLESETRKLALDKDSIKIWAGSVGEVKKVGRLSIPQKCWKVIYVKATGEWLAYVFENDASKPNGLADNKTTVQKVEELTNFKFK
jgi:endonuclease G